VHVAHVGGHSRLLPLPQTLAALTQRLSARHAYEVEASLSRPLCENAPRLCLVLYWSHAADCTLGAQRRRLVKALADVSALGG
jgi:hypothetical protein